MSRPTTILAATDFSAPARHAADRAALLAHEARAQLTLMHVIAGGRVAQLREWFAQQQSAEQSLHDEARERLERLAGELKAHRHVTVRTVHSVGDVVQDLLVEASALDAELIVVGARGTGFLRRLVLGTTAERLLRRASRPVLMVRERAHEGYRRALVALDFSAVSAALLATVRRLAPRARLVLLHAFEVPFESKLRFAGVDGAAIEHQRQQVRGAANRRLHALAQSAGLARDAYEACVVEGDASQRIVELEQEADCDLVVVGKHGQSVVEDLLLGSVTLHVLSEGSTDVLVCPIGEEQEGLRSHDAGGPARP
ncbi:MAG: universal stress protein [Burkholderiaceae bacterium]|nr:universal stress protein [Burkholderiaceae bacterium]